MSKKQEFVWAYDRTGEGEVMHAVDEFQVATSQVALCGVDPVLYGRWHRADVQAFTEQKKCLSCRRRTIHMRDVTARANRAVQKMTEESRQ
jgi:hypothetical protein